MTNRFKKFRWLFLAIVFTFITGDIAADQGLLLGARRRQEVPVGIIIPFNDTSVPSGWERFTSADGKQIVGAGDTYAVAGTGGTNLASITRTSSVAGAHTNSGTTFSAIQNVGGNATTGSVTGSPGSAGGHDHDLTMNYERAYQQLLLIKSTEPAYEFPANGIVLSTEATTPVTGLSICYDGDMLLRSDSTITTGGGSFTNEACEEAGAHEHDPDGTVYTTGDSETGYNHILAGEHEHTYTPTLSSATLKRIYITAWTDTNGFKNSAGVIAMWEGSTAPAGWELATELQNYFVMLSSTGNAGDTHDEANQLSVAISVDNATNNHSHNSGSGSSETLAIVSYHGAADNVHGHTVSTTGSAHTPAYYALTFIRKL